MAGILVVDDDNEVGTFFKRLLERKGYTVHVACNGEETNALLDVQDFQAALVDLKLPDINGLELLNKIKMLQPACEVIIMTGYSTTRSAVKAIQMGAFDYIEKPFEDINNIEELIKKAIDFGHRAQQGERDTPEWLGIADRLGLQVGNNQKMRRLVEVAYKIAKKDINVLLQGETGTGKEILARFIHACSDRAEKTFIPINCGAFQESLLETELFGHEKGAFTGASGRHKGIFEVADGGTLFLDEIGEASLSIQVKLLRVLETGEFFRVGGEKAIKTDVRVIAATNVDLQKAVEEKRFREDLFYRLDVVRLEIPPLRDRREDIPLLVNYILKHSLEDETTQVYPEAMQYLQEYAWPGNIREMKNVLSQSLALLEGNIILPSSLPAKLINEVQRSEKSGVASSPAKGSRENYRSLVYRLEEILDHPRYIEELSQEGIVSAYNLTRQLLNSIQNNMYQRGMPGSPPRSLAEVEKNYIEETLSFYGGNVSNSARALGIGRNTLYRKMKDYGIKYK